MTMAGHPIPSEAWISEQLVEFLSSRFNLPKSLLQGGTSLTAALGLGQVALQALTGRLVNLPFIRDYGARISASAVDHVQTVADLAGIIRQSLVAAARPVAVSGKTPRTKKTAAKKSRNRIKAAAPPSSVRRPIKSRALPGVAGSLGGGPRPIGFHALRDVGSSSEMRVTPLTGGRAAPPIELSRSRASPVETANDVPRKAPRYANAALLDRSSGHRLDQNISLSPGQVVRLRLDIGKLSRKSQVSNPKPIDKKLPKDIDLDLDVMVSSSDLSVATDAAALDSVRPPRIATGRFLLPGDGSPATTSNKAKYLIFYLKVPGDQKQRRVLHARVGYYYRNILVQSQHLSAHVGEPGGFTITTDFTVSNDLTGLGNIPERPRISVLTNANADGSHQIVLRHPGTPRDGGDPSATLAVNSGTLGTTINSLRKVLTLQAPETAIRSRAELEDDLRRIVPIGRQLYNQLPGQKEFSFFVDLYEHPEAYVVQVARPATSSFVMPWSFIYEIPLSSNVEPTLCPLVAQWDGKRPLFEDAPRQCPHGPHQRDVLCPFGFWGFRYAIEQIASADKLVTEIPAAANCDCVVGETQYQIDLKLLDSHVAKLRATLAKALPEATLREGKDRASLEKMLGNDLPFIYFFCHGNKLNVVDPNTWIAVGNNEAITTGDIIGWPQIWYSALKKSFWNDVRPLIFINACHSLAIEPETLVSYLDAFVGRGHAAGVIGTEVKVSQALAMNVAEQFFESWLAGEQTVETVLRAIRLDYLRQGNLFGLVYTPYCWSELQIKKR
jgi:hypothetical protein